MINSTLGFYCPNFSNEGFIQGNWYLWPEDTKHIPTQFFHENECFESSLEEVIPISKVKGKCVILNLRDYQASKRQHFVYSKLEIYAMLRVTRHHLYNFKNVKNNHGAVLPPAKLYAKTCNPTRSNTPPQVFFTPYKLCKCSKLRKASHMARINDPDEKALQSLIVDNKDTKMMLKALCMVQETLT